MMLRSRRIRRALTSIYVGSAFFLCIGGASCLALADFKLEILKSFEWPGSPPSGQAALVLGGDGALYGTANRMIFRLDTTGVVTPLHRFHRTPEPQSELVLGSDGALYGTTSNSVVRIDSGGTLTVLHSFGPGAFAYPYPPLVQGIDGALYGTSNCEAFKIDSLGNFRSLHYFNQPDDTGYCPGIGGGSFPVAPLALGSEGALYGTTPGYYGGATIFKIDSAGSYSLLYEFPEGDRAYYGTPLLTGGDGAMYGVSQGNGSSLPPTIFRVDSAGTYTSLHSFALADELPAAALVLGSDGSLYGTTFGLGSRGGVIYRIDNLGTFFPLHSLRPDEYAYAPLAQGSDGAFYGTTTRQGPGDARENTIFKIDSSGTFTSLHSLAPDDFYYHSARLTIASDGSVYGTTEGGGSAGLGTIFKVDNNGAFTSLHSFTSPEGYGPRLRLRANNALYGTTASGGVSGGGTIFRMDESGAFTFLHAFDSEGTFNSAGATLVQGSDGAVYGTTAPNGVSALPANGTVFKVDATGAFSSVHSFNGLDGSGPNGLILASDGSLYGATTRGGSANLGTIFKVDDVGEFSSLHSIDGSPERGFPILRVRGGDGSLYGTVGYGCRGGVFRVDIPGIFVPLLDWALPEGAFGCGVSSLIQTTDGTLYVASYPGGAVRIDSSGGGSLPLSTGAGFVFGGDGIVYATDGGTIFKIDAAGHATTVYSLDRPYANGISRFSVEHDGTLYGQALATISEAESWLFRVDPDGSVTSLHTFTPEDGINPSPELVHGGDCALYGTAETGGPAGGGVVYRLYQPGHLCQQIDLESLPDRTVGDRPFMQSAIASSGLPVSFSASGSCAVSGDQVTLTGVGPCTLTASQPGDADYEPAPEVSQSFDVLFDFAGFLRPVLNPPVVNQVKAGRTVPIRFRLGGDLGRDVVAEGSPSVRPVPCDASAPVNEIAGLVTKRSSSLHHAPKRDRYTYLWQTDRSWAGTCQELSLELIDGSVHRAMFHFEPLPRPHERRGDRW